MVLVVSQELADAGLQLQAAVPVVDLNHQVQAALVDASVDLGSYRSLVMFAQAGRRLFEQHVANNVDLADPFDETAIDLVSTWIETEIPATRFEFVYPGPALLPLGRLARAVGWGSASPLGLTIHPDYGLWLAHRVVVLIDTDLDSVSSNGAHPCVSCSDTPCVDACPVGAVSVATGFDVESCSHHRIEAESTCEYQCLARNACPVGAGHRYGPEQMRHHYGAGLTSIRRWLEP